MLNKKTEKLLLFLSVFAGGLIVFWTGFFLLLMRLPLEKLSISLWICASLIFSFLFVFAMWISSQHKEVSPKDAANK